VNEIAPQARSAESSQPSPYADRRSLSEAWYRALFDPRAGNRVASSAAGPVPVPNAGPPASSWPARVSASRSSAVAHDPPPKGARVRLVRAVFAPQARAFARTQRQREAAQPACRKVPLKRTFCGVTLPDGEAVDLLVQQRGDVLRLVAIYDGRSAQRVAAALHAARAALLRRGMNLEINAIRKGTS
jgi:hypothetical protein